MTSDERPGTSDEASGFDMDIWGGNDTTPVLIPERGRPDNGCPRQEAGRCPPHCQECEVFALQLNGHQVTEIKHKGT